MKTALLMLFMALAFNSGGERNCREYCALIHKKGKITRYEEASGLKHSITDRECKLIDEWLNRKNIGHFLKNHMNSKQP